MSAFKLLHGIAWRIQWAIGPMIPSLTKLRDHDSVGAADVFWTVPTCLLLLHV